MVSPSAPWAAYLGPDPIAHPPASTINFVGNQTAGNGLTVALSSHGTLSATYMGPAGATTHLVFDVTGFYATDASGQTYHPIDPVRSLDTRHAIGLPARLSANTPACFSVAGRNGLPLEAKAVTGNVTVVNPSAAWAVYLGPVSTSKPSTSAVNFTSGQVAGNNLSVSLDSAGRLCATYMGPAGAKTDLVFDVTGFYTADMSGSAFVPIAPTRLLDTRAHLGLPSCLLANSPSTFPIARQAALPDGLLAVTGNVTVVNDKSGWAVYLGPVAEASPGTSTVNFLGGQSKGNGLSVALGPGGVLTATYMGPSGATTDLVFDVTGYFLK